MPSRPLMRPGSFLFWLRSVVPGFLFCCVLVAPFIQLPPVVRMDRGTHGDLYAPWTGVKAALHRQDPYSDAVTQRIQRDIYGHALRPTDTWDPEAFVYPAFIIFLLGPFTVLPWAVVYVLFGALAPVALAVTIWAWMHICQPGLSRRATIAVYALILASWPAVWGYHQRQPSLFVGAAAAVSILLFRRRYDLQAGTLLALTAVKPQLVILIVPWLLVVALVQRRWRFLSAFLLTLSALLGGAMALVPDWIPHWLHASAAYAHYPGKNPLLIFLLGRPAGVTLTVALLGVLCFRLWQLGLAAPDTPAFSRAVALLLAATVCIIPGDAWLVFNDLLLIPAILVLFRHGAGKSVPGLLPKFAGAALCLAVAVTPLCAAMGMRFGFTLNLLMPPFLLNYLVPVPVAVALLCTRPEMQGETRVLPSMEALKTPA